MKKLKINSQKHGKLERKFETQGELDLYLETIGDHWGKSEWIELIPEVMDDAGNTLEPAKQIIHPAEYTYEIIDITQEVEQEKTKKDKKEKDKKDRVVELKNIDWKNVDSITELKQIVKVLVNETLKDEE